MPKKNPYLEKRRAEQEQRDIIVMAWAHQTVYDALTLVLNDPEVMHKDVFGKKRLNRLCKALNEKMNEILPGLSNRPNASHVRRLVDDELRKICGDDFIPWAERYEYWDDRGI